MPMKPESILAESVYGFITHQIRTIRCIIPTKKRGQDAINEMGVIPSFSGILCHDHWKPYYRYTCLHSLCNAHHLRELERALEKDTQQWAKNMQKLLLEINNAVDSSGGSLDPPTPNCLKSDIKRFLKKLIRNVRPLTIRGKKVRRGESPDQSREICLRDFEISKVMS